MTAPKEGIWAELCSSTHSLYNLRQPSSCPAATRCGCFLGPKPFVKGAAATGPSSKDLLELLLL